MICEGEGVGSGEGWLGKVEGIGWLGAVGPLGTIVWWHGSS